ncbi:hypothetical protein HYQ45_008314 [Verticillium longisporum]|uniref:Acyclic terpene utilisation N-terminal domain-containing protein n=1 Tax=Verticillium longisporum TaxID=100787 RepID=A0A8I2ZMV5_VERLO|nr:hypothetical protein HYQ45_008314 [Verticillium longisporum]
MASYPKWREGDFGVRPVRIANCSGYHGDPPSEMYKQVKLGDVDFITGDYLAEKKIKVAVNGGALNPQGLARKVAELVNSKGYDMRVAYVSGDDILPRLGRDIMPQGPDESLPYLDAANPHINLFPEAT